MSKRLASFGGPSTPTSSPVAGQSTPTKSGGKKKPTTPASPDPRSPRSKLEASVHAPRKAKVPEETEVQRLVRTTLKRASRGLEEWSRVCTKIGLQDAKTMIDLATELDNALGSFSSEVQPRFRIVTDKLYRIDALRENIRRGGSLMIHYFMVLAKRANKLEQALTEYVRTNGIEAAEQTPLWADKTWSLGQHVLHIHKILRPLNRFQHTLQELSEKIIAYGLAAGLNGNQDLSETKRPEPGRGVTVPTFEETRSAMVIWAAEAKTVEELITEWKEICALEVVGWDKKVGSEPPSSDEDEDTD